MPLNLVSDSRPTPEFDTNQDCTPRPQAVCRTLLVAFSSIFLPPFVFLFLCSKQRRIVVLAVTQNPTVHKSVSALGTDTRTLDRALSSPLCEWTDSVQPCHAAVWQREMYGRDAELSRLNAISIAARTRERKVKNLSPNRPIRRPGWQQ